MICLFRNIAVSVLIGCIRLYRALFIWKQPCCRYLPTCSQYAIDAIHKRGVFAGCALAVWRLLRCHPFGGQGYDPVPDGANRCTHHHDKGFSHG